MEQNILQKLYDVVVNRKENPEEGSYTCYLFGEGMDKILKKVGEESAEVIIAAKNKETMPLVGEVSDLLYHLMVLLVEADIPYALVEEELNMRAQKIGNLKEMKQVDKNS